MMLRQWATLKPFEFERWMKNNRHLGTKHGAQVFLDKRRNGTCYILLSVTERDRRVKTMWDNREGDRFNPLTDPPSLTLVGYHGLNKSKRFPMLIDSGDIPGLVEL